MSLVNLGLYYEYLSEKDKLEMIEDQLTELEKAQFGLKVSEPSSITESAQHTQWKSQITAVENAIVRVRDKRAELFPPTDQDLINDEQLLKMREEE